MLKKRVKLIIALFLTHKKTHNMKKTLLFIGLGFALNQVTAQTITSANVANMGDTVINGIDVSPSLNLGTAGTGNTWNFSTLLINSRDTTIFANPNAIPCASATFGAANFTIMQDTNFGFVEKTSSSLRVLGLSNGTFCVPSQDTETLMEFPSSFGSSFLDTSVTFTTVPGSIAQLPVDSAQVNSITYINSNFDASGTLTTPFGLFPVIRQYLERRTVTDIFIKIAGNWSPTPAITLLDTSWSHQYWSDAANAKFPLVSYDITAAGSLTGQVNWTLKYSENPTASITEKEILQVSVYPNPVIDYLNIEADQEIEKVTIMTVSGKVVFAQENFKSKRIDVQNLPKGMYLLTVETGNSIGNSKFIK